MELPAAFHGSKSEVPNGTPPGGGMPPGAGIPPGGGMPPGTGIPAVGIPVIPVGAILSDKRQRKVRKTHDF